MATKAADLADIYQEKTDIEHILDAPDTYIGSTEADVVKNWVLNDEDNMKYIYLCLDCHSANIEPHIW